MKKWFIETVGFIAAVGILLMIMASTIAYSHVKVGVAVSIQGINE